MNNETDLNWLARNVHVWPYGMREVLARHSRNVDTLIWSRVLSNAGWITKDQWLARRAELQNKPSWKDAPEWATHLAQSAGGDWEWFAGAPEPSLEARENGHIGIQSKWMGKTNSGEVLGDWRDTLERRPENTRAEMEVELVKAAFKPFTGIEDNQDLNMSNKQEVKQDGGWFERGELPPVGVVCETLAEPESQWVAAEVVAHRDGFAIVWATSEKCGAQCDDPKHFRPIRTERELAIEEMMKAMNVIDFVGTPHHLASEISAIMYDAGYRKDPK